MEKYARFDIDIGDCVQVTFDRNYQSKIGRESYVFYGIFSGEKSNLFCFNQGAMVVKKRVDKGHIELRDGYIDLVRKFSKNKKIYIPKEDVSDICRFGLYSFRNNFNVPLPFKRDLRLK